MLSNAVIALRLVLAAMLGGFIGFEREIHGRAAGLRTHTLVCLGSALIMLTSIKMSEIYGLAACDPARIAAGVVTGIGFLGAGTIMRSRASVRGLTTAASLWGAAAIGLAVGTGFYSGAAITSGLILIVLMVFARLEHNIIRKDWYRVLVIDTKGDAEHLAGIRSVIADYHGQIRDFEAAQGAKEKYIKLRVNLKLATDRDDGKIIADIMKLDGVAKVKWE